MSYNYNETITEANVPISKEQAWKIAYTDENLINDFFCNYKGHLTWLSFTEKKIEFVTDGTNYYWKISVTDTDISGESRDGGMWDGSLDTKDLKKLICLVNAITGEYIYYPEKTGIKKLVSDIDDFFRAIGRRNIS